MAAYCQVNSSGLFKYGTLKRVHKMLGQKFPAFHEGAFVTQDQWAADLSDRILVIMSHARRLKDPVRWQQAVLGLGTHQVEALERIKGYIGDDSDTSSAAVVPKKVLKLRHSEISVDSMGLPAVKEAFEDEAAMPELPEQDPLVLDAEATSPVPARKEVLKKIMEANTPGREDKKRSTPDSGGPKKTILKKPSQATMEMTADQKKVMKDKARSRHIKKSKVTKKKDTAKPKTNLPNPRVKLKYVPGATDEDYGEVPSSPSQPKEPQEPQTPQASKERPISNTFGKLFVVKAKKQSYIQYMEGGHKKLLISIPETMHNDHHMIIDHLVEFCLTPNISKEMVKAKRQQLVES